MNPKRLLEFKPVDNPERRDRVVEKESQQSGSNGPERSYRRRFVGSSWARPTRLRSAWTRAVRARLSASEERTLAKLIQAGDAVAKQQLITANLALVLRAVSDYKRCGVPLDDLVQEGNLGLIRAARHFNPSTHSARFATYATYWIRRAIVRALASNGPLIPLPENSHLLRLRYRRAVSELCAQGATARGDIYSKSPGLGEIAGYLGVPASRLKRARLTQREPRVSLKLDDKILADGPAPDQNLVNNENRAFVHEALRRLSPFEAWVICERFGLGEPLSGRGTPRNSSERDLADETAERAILAGPAGAAAGRGLRPTQSYYHRSYIEMGRDCGLSVLRLRQVEKTALDKLRGFLSRRAPDET